jgi:hypothetical protein
MPLEFIDYGNSWLVHHPGWAMHTWTDTHVSGIVNLRSFHRSKAQSGRANVLRYEILLHYGGVYIDTDFECLRNIEPLLNGVSCFVGLQSQTLANNAIIGAIPGHPFLLDLVRGIAPRVDAMPAQLPIRQSGPYYLSERLRGRTDVTIFPAKWFYPYAWHERWRRWERFPEAYAVHHWALTWKRRRISRACSSIPRVSVMIISTTRDDLRLEWVLEGLCEQSAAGRFEVVVLDSAHQESIRRLVSAYVDRLRICYVATNNCQRGLLSDEVQHQMRSCRGERVVLLDGRCIPDSQLVETHAELGNRAIVGLSGYRVYPQQKVFRFVPPLDYDALKIHSISVEPQAGPNTNWRDVKEACISVPRSSMLRLHIPAQLGVRAGGKWLARELSVRGHRLMSMSNEAKVTCLA